MKHNFIKNTLLVFTVLAFALPLRASADNIPNCSATVSIAASPTTLSASNNATTINVVVIPQGTSDSFCRQQGALVRSMIVGITDGKSGRKIPITGAPQETGGSTIIAVGQPATFNASFVPSTYGWTDGESHPITVKVLTYPVGTSLNSQELASQSVTISVAAPQAATPATPVQQTPAATPTATPSYGSGLIGEFIPSCVDFQKGDQYLSSQCGSVTIFLVLALNIVNYLFGIIGGVALLFFVYGGFTWIMSQGSPDKIEKGKSIILAAVLGIIIAFGGYAAVKFMGNVVGLNSEYQLK